MLRPHVIQASSADELRERLHELRDGGYQAGLAIVFISDRILNEELLTPFREEGIAVFGSCSSEEIIHGRISNESIVALLLDLPATAFQLKIFQSPRENPGRSLGRAVGEAMRAAFENPVAMLLIGGGGLAINTEEVLSGVFSVLPDAPIFGGLPSSLGAFDQPPFFTARKLYGTGIYALILDSDVVDVQGVAISGWQELGTPKRITRSAGNRVYEIEGVPATTFYQNYFNLSPATASARLNNVDPELLATSEYPILLRRADGSEVMRAAIQMDAEDKSVSYGGDIPQDSLVRFCSPNVIETIQHTVEELQTFRTNEIAGGADAVLLFNCAVRSRALGPYMRRELAVIQSLLPAPLVGFSSWGEIGQTPGQECGFHNVVISMVTLRDRKRAPSPAAQPQDFSAAEVEALVADEKDDSDGDTVQSLRGEVEQLRREKRILSHFLRLTSGDLEREQQKSEELLLNILPASIAERLKRDETVIADSVNEASVLFTDLVGFTALSSGMQADRLVEILNDLFSRFDELTADHGVEKIKTIGDAYMAVAGLPLPVADHADRCVRLGRAMLDAVTEVNRAQNIQLQLRVGINTGPVVAGVIGKRKFSYDLWGDTVNVASRMESHGEAGRIQISETSYALLAEREGWTRRENVELKGKGRVTTYITEATA
ncbi:MAG: FIST C-terminal domain-containing protein [bacterium]|nr:FIST C-terminal domain-containing protein [bacterium]